MAEHREWVRGTNSRGYEYMRCERKHLSLPKLKADEKLTNQYLRKENIPRYPKYVFEEAKVCHVTDLSGLQKIFADGGFKTEPSIDGDPFLYWSLSVPGKIRNQEPFPEEFATSFAFQTESLYGNFCFTFPLTKLLKHYTNMPHNYSPPILRVLDTTIYKKEIAYTILVHPKHMGDYRKYPRLPFNVSKGQVCGYSQRKIYWRCQSPSESYQYHLNLDEETGQEFLSLLNRNEYFVWDNVHVAFHMKKDWTLKIDRRLLVKSLSACEAVPNSSLKEPIMSLEEAEREVRKLKNQVRR